MYETGIARLLFHCSLCLTRISGYWLPENYSFAILIIMLSIAGDELLPPIQHYPMDDVKQDSEDVSGGMDQQQEEEEEEEEREEEALEGMGVGPAIKHEQVPLMTEPPIVLPNSGLHHQHNRAAAGAYSVVSHRERVPESASEDAFSFSGDLPDGDPVGQGAYRMPEPNDSKSRANGAVTRAKEKAAAIKARAANKGNRKFGQY